MKKYFLTLFVVSLVLGAYVPKTVVAATPTEMMVSVTPSPMMEASAEGIAQKKAEYVLPYPGILADHTLYFLKKFRDQILEKLISDPAKKVEFSVLQADKQLNAGIFLEAKGKMALAATMFTEEAQFMKQAVATLATFKTQGKAVPAYVLERLNTAITVHIEFLNDQMQSVEASYKEQVKAALDNLKALQKDVQPSQQ